MLRRTLGQKLSVDFTISRLLNRDPAPASRAPPSEPVSALQAPPSALESVWVLPSVSPLQAALSATVKPSVSQTCSGTARRSETAKRLATETGYYFCR